MITILIISILAGLILGVASVAGETAREAQSRHTVARLHTLLTEHYETYKMRRVRLHPAVSNASSTGVIDKLNNATDAEKGRLRAEARLYALREMMLMEIPDRWSDVLLTDIGSSTPRDPTQALPPLYLAGRTDLSMIYLRRYASLVGRTNSLTGEVNTADDIKRNQGAECLYMVVTIACGEGEARSLFGESSIGDSDGDGAPEFLDGWNRPINFLRWAPGFDSLIQLNANLLGTPPPPGPASSTLGANAWETEANRDHDPFDMFRVDRAAFRLVPLIYSPGRDEDSGIHSNVDHVAWRPASPNAVAVSSTNPRYLIPRLTPYIKNTGPEDPDYLGTAHHVTDPELDATSTDNIHNHLLGQR